VSDLPHWSDDPYWATALTALATARSRKAEKLVIDLAAIESIAFLENGPSFRLMKAMVSVWQRESSDSFQGAPRVMLALLVRLAELSENHELER